MSVMCLHDLLILSHRKSKACLPQFLNISHSTTFISINLTQLNISHTQSLSCIGYLPNLIIKRLYFPWFKEQLCLNGMEFPIFFN